MRDIAENSCDNDYRKTVSYTLVVKKFYTPAAECTSDCNCYSAENDADPVVDLSGDCVSHSDAVKNRENT